MKKFESKPAFIKFNSGRNLFCVIARLILFLNIFLIINSSYSQSDTLNKLNSSGKKHGYWKVLLNEKVDPVKKIEDACFYGIEYWDNGKPVQKFYKHTWKYSKIECDGYIPPKGKPELISGIFKWLDKDGSLLNDESYRKGQPKLIRSYTTCGKDNPGMHIFEEIVFTKLYNNIPGTFYVEMHVCQKNEPSKKYWFRKGEKGWKSYKIEE